MRLIIVTNTATATTTTAAATTTTTTTTTTYYCIPSVRHAQVYCTSETFALPLHLSG
jgi:hypothetical protein